MAENDRLRYGEFYGTIFLEDSRPPSSDRLTLADIDRAVELARATRPRIEPIRGWRLWRSGYFRCLPWRSYYIWFPEKGSPAYEALNG